MHRRGKKKVKSGNYDNWHQLFLKRLDREGRWREFQKARSELYHTDGWTSGFKATWIPVARDFGFESKEDEIERFEEFMLSGGRSKMQKELAEMQDEIRVEQAMESVGEIVEVGGMKLPADIAWIYSHQAMLRAEPVTITQADHRGAPSRGAVGMLAHYANERKDFYKLVLSHMAKQDADEGTTADEAEAKQGIAEITSMLEGL